MYNPKKKTSLWDVNAKPEDAKGQPLMKSTTQIMLEEGSKPAKKICQIQRSLINFASFDLEDPRYGYGKLQSFQSPRIVSSYKRSFKAPFSVKYEPIKPKELSPDFLLNRKPKNDFELKTGLQFKFMDDHISNLTEGRKKINFFRQIRNISYFNY